MTPKLLTLLFLTVTVYKAQAFQASNLINARSGVCNELISLNMGNRNDDLSRKVASSLVAIGIIASSVCVVGPAAAIDPSFGGSSIEIAARSGGRAGGRAAPRAMPRSSSTRMYSSPPSRGYTGGSTTIIRPMYSSPVMVSPFGYGYSPFGGLGGFGMGYGLGSMNNNNNGGNQVNQQREYEEQKDLAQNKAELEMSKQREAQLEDRIKAIEGQMNQVPK